MIQSDCSDTTVCQKVKVKQQTVTAWFRIHDIIKQRKELLSG